MLLPGEPPPARLLPTNHFPATCPAASPHQPPPVSAVGLPCFLSPVCSTAWPLSPTGAVDVSLHAGMQRRALVVRKHGQGRGSRIWPQRTPANLASPAAPVPGGGQWRGGAGRDGVRGSRPTARAGASRQRAESRQAARKEAGSARRAGKQHGQGRGSRIQIDPQPHPLILQRRLHRARDAPAGLLPLRVGAPRLAAGMVNLPDLAMVEILRGGRHRLHIRPARARWSQGVPRPDAVPPVQDVSPASRARNRHFDGLPPPPELPRACVSARFLLCCVWLLLNRLNMQ